MKRSLHRAFLLLALISASVGGLCWGNALARLSPGEAWPFWLWPLAAACTYAGLRFVPLLRRREGRAGLLLAAGLLFSQLLGRQYDFIPLNGSVLTAGDWTVWLQLFGCAVLLAPALAWPLTEALLRLGRAAGTAQEGEPSGGRRLGDRAFFVICLGVLFLAWQPCRLAYYPGLAEYDSGYQLWQNWNHNFDASNPLFHTLLLGLFYLRGEAWATVTAGLALYTILQQLLLAACISAALYTLRRSGAPRWTGWVSMGFFALLPVFGMLSISMTKDVPFYALVLLQLTLIFDGCRRPERARRWRYWLGLGLVTLFAALLRANALVAMFAIAPLVGLVWREKGFRRRLIAVMLAATALAFGINEGLIAVLNATRPQLRESLNVPIIQLARTAVYHEEAAADLTENETDLVEMPLSYIPYVVDLAKWHWHVDSGNLLNFARLWGRYLRQYPGDYLEALLLVNKGYWYLGDISFSRVYGHDISQRLGVLPSRVTANISTIEEHCFLPAFQAYMERMYSANEYQAIPVYRLLLCPALYVWLLLFGLAACRCQQRRDVRMAVRHVLLYLLALLLGPCCILRYALILMLFVPVMLGMLLTPEA